jgi:hypothetical protein
MFAMLMSMLLPPAGPHAFLSDTWCFRTPAPQDAEFQDTTEITVKPVRLSDIGRASRMLATQTIVPLSRAAAVRFGVDSGKRMYLVRGAVVAPNKTRLPEVIEQVNFELKWSPSLKYLLVVMNEMFAFKLGERQELQGYNVPLLVAAEQDIRGASLGCFVHD